MLWSQKGFVSYTESFQFQWCDSQLVWQVLVSNNENNAKNDTIGVGFNEKNLILWSVGIIFPV